MWFAPNIATAIDIMSRPELRRPFGGGTRFMLSFLLTIVFVIAALVRAMGKPLHLPGAAC